MQEIFLRCFVFSATFWLSIATLGLSLVSSAQTLALRGGKMLYGLGFQYEGQWAVGKYFRGH